VALWPGGEHELPPILANALNPKAELIDLKAELLDPTAEVLDPATREAGGGVEAGGRRWRSGSARGPDSPPQARIRRRPFFPQQRRRARTTRSELLRAAPPCSFPGCHLLPRLLLVLLNARGQLPQAMCEGKRETAAGRPRLRDGNVSIRGSSADALWGAPGDSLTLFHFKLRQFPFNTVYTES
jgi:hypothetical protein